jgi:hypothetical protein
MRYVLGFGCEEAPLWSPGERRTLSAVLTELSAFTPSRLVFVGEELTSFAVESLEIAGREQLAVPPVDGTFFAAEKTPHLLLPELRRGETVRLRVRYRGQGNPRLAIALLGEALAEG